MLLQGLNPKAAVVVATVPNFLVIGSLALQVLDKDLHLSDFKLEGSLGLVGLFVHETDAFVQLVNFPQSILRFGVSR